MENNDAPYELLIYVAPDGDDRHSGAIAQPLRTLHCARERVRQLKHAKGHKPISVYLREGTYYLEEPLEFGPEDSGSPDGPIQYRAYPGERVILSGGCRISGNWRPYRDGIWMTDLPDLLTREDVPGVWSKELYVNGSRQIRARYPNADSDQPLMDGPGYLQAAGGTDRRPDPYLAFDPDSFTKKHWQRPETGIVHAFQSHYWGNMQYQIAGVDREQCRLQLGAGGFQLQRSFGISPRSRYYIDHIFEELDAPNEWFLDAAARTLYYYPPAGIDLDKAVVELACLQRLVTFRGSASHPVSHISMINLAFAHTGNTFMEPYEDLSLGDWSIHRGGTVFMEGAEDCRIADSCFDAVGGNAVFLSGYNRRITVEGCKFEDTGDSAVCFVGEPHAVRSYRTWQGIEQQSAPERDELAGPASPDYPMACVVRNNIMRRIGLYGKQTAGVLISMSRRITVSHNTIYEVPRAAICINDGTWGGHVIEHNDIWETVRETGEHGPFNAWGRDRQWGDQSQSDTSGIGEMRKEAVFLDALEPNRICGNRIVNMRRSVSAGNWTIDLDDGSSNYHICGNLCLGSTLKLRDGYYRSVANNIFVSPVPLGWHVWPTDSGDTFTRNIVVVAGTRLGETTPTDAVCRPIRMPEHPWGREIDRNLYWNANTRHFLVRETSPDREYTWEVWNELGYDRHSVVADPQFTDPLSGDYRLRPESPAWAIGFEPIDMDQFGHTQTRIVPLGGSFAGTIEVVIRPDDRGGQVWYTVDGSAPEPGNPAASLYREPASLSCTATVRAVTFNHGEAQGFEQIAEFQLVDHAVLPSWLQALTGGQAPEPEVPHCGRADVSNALHFLGAQWKDIQDGDLIDALGGHDRGVLLTEAPTSSVAYRAGLRISDVLVRWGEHPIRAISDLEALTDSHDELQPIQVVVLRGYETKLFDF